MKVDQDVYRTTSSVKSVASQSPVNVDRDDTDRYHIRELLCIQQLKYPSLKDLLIVQQSSSIIETVLQQQNNKPKPDQNRENDLSTIPNHLAGAHNSRTINAGIQFRPGFSLPQSTHQQRPSRHRRFAASPDTKRSFATLLLTVTYYEPIKLDTRSLIVC